MKSVQTFLLLLMAGGGYPYQAQAAQTILCGQSATVERSQTFYVKSPPLDVWVHRGHRLQPKRLSGPSTFTMGRHTFKTSVSYKQANKRNTVQGTAKITLDKNIPTGRQTLTLHYKADYDGLGLAEGIIKSMKYWRSCRLVVVSR